MLANEKNDLLYLLNMGWQRQLQQERYAKYHHKEL